MFKNVLNKANQLAKQLQAKESISSAQESIGQAIKVAKHQRDVVIQENWPKVENLLHQNLLGLAENKLKDDKFLAGIFDVTYEAIPIPMRLVLSREKFIEFCFARKKQVLTKLGLDTACVDDKQTDSPASAAVIYAQAPEEDLPTLGDQAKKTRSNFRSSTKHSPAAE